MRVAWMSGLAAVVLGALQPAVLGVLQPAAPTQSAMGQVTGGVTGDVQPKVVLVELFTSEGCSSCPPADRMLREIDGKRSAQGTLVVGVSEHVTYWDHDGWKDPYGSELATDRQREYADRFRLDSSYTPQMVVNGEAQFVGGDTKSFLGAMEKGRPVGAGAVKIGSVTVDGDVAKVTVAIGGELPAKGADVMLVVAEDETTQRVLAGENRGKTLSHAAVARTLQRVGRVKQAGESVYTVKLPGVDAGTGRHLVVWVQEPGLGPVVGVDSRAF